MSRSVNEGAVPGRHASPISSETRTDAELVWAVGQGDKGAFVELVTRFQSMVCGIALAILGNFAASEDAAQEAFLSAWQKHGELREPEKFKCWHSQIARNAAMAHRRRYRFSGTLPDCLQTARPGRLRLEICAISCEAGRRRVQAFPLKL